MRTVNEVCIAVDQATQLATLRELRREVVLNKKKYPLVEVNFMLEHIKAAVKAMARHDVIELRNGLKIFLG